MNIEFLRSDRKPESMKGIKNKKCKNTDIQTPHIHSEYIVADQIITFGDGTTYKVRADGSWVRTSKKKDK
jgi:hypothetical protein